MRCQLKRVFGSRVVESLAQEAADVRQRDDFDPLRSRTGRDSGRAHPMAGLLVGSKCCVADIGGSSG